MNKKELINKVTVLTDLKKTDVTETVNALFNTIAGAMANGDKVSVTNFGVFTVRGRAERMGRNPQTGKSIKIKATKVPGFKAGKGLKIAVKG